MNFAVDPFLFLNIKSKYLRGDIQISFTPAPKCFRHFLMGTTWLHTPASPTHGNNRGQKTGKKTRNKKVSLLSVINFPACPKFCLSVPQLEKAYEIAQTKIWTGAEKYHKTQLLIYKPQCAGRHFETKLMSQYVEIHRKNRFDVRVQVLAHLKIFIWWNSRTWVNVLQLVKSRVRNKLAKSEFFFVRCKSITWLHWAKLPRKQWA